MAQLVDDDVAIAQQLNVERHVTQRFAVDEDLWDVSWKSTCKHKRASMRNVSFIVIVWQGLLGIRATGRTLSEDPMTMIKSHSSLSMAIELWNSSGKPSPKKTMSGFITA